MHDGNDRAGLVWLQFDGAAGSLALYVASLYAEMHGARLVRRVAYRNDEAPKAGEIGFSLDEVHADARPAGFCSGRYSD